MSGLPEIVSGNPKTLKMPDMSGTRNTFRRVNANHGMSAVSSVTSAKIAGKPDDADEKVWAISESNIVTDIDGDRSLTAEILVYIPPEDYFETKQQRILRK